MNEPCNILCVDDDEDDRDFVCSVLKEINPSINLAHATDGIEAIKYLATAKQQEDLPTLILLDINMPKLDGKATLLEIKKDDALSKIPVVIFTTSASPADKAFCAKYGVEMLTKPSNFNGFVKEMNRLLDLC